MEVIWGKIKEKAHEELHDADEYRRMSEEMRLAGEHKCAAVLSDMADEEEIHMKHLTEMLSDKSGIKVVSKSEEQSEMPIKTAF